MRMLLVLATLGWIISQPWMAVVGYFVLIVAAIVILWFLSVSIERCAASPRRGHTAIDADYVAALEVLVAEAEAETRMLRVEIAELRASQPAAARSKVAALHARVGLTENAPEWLVASARRAYRSALHPDRHPAHRKQEADRRFKLAQATFDAIASARS